MDYKALPKIELHAHLNGSLSNENILELHRMKYSTQNGQEGLSNGYKIEKELSELSECFRRFKYAHDLTDSPERLARATEIVISDFNFDGVVYLEIRTTPRATEHMSKETYLITVCQAILNSYENFPSILVKLIPSIDRSQGAAAAAETVDLILSVRQKFPELIVGIDLSGNPANTKFPDFQDALQKARDSGLKLALHCAETAGTFDENMEMLEFGMDRMGHGTFIAEHPDTWMMLVQKKILVECCISSNIKCNTVSDVTKHHVKKLLDAAHPVAICTDDFGVFDTCLSKEFELCTNTFALSHKIIEEICINSIRYSFATAAEKTRLEQLICDFFTQIDHL